MTLRAGEFLWCRPYYLLSPDWCFVLDDGSGKAVGYILCAPDTPAFVQQWRKDFLPLVASHGILEPEPSERLIDRPVHLRHDIYKPEYILHKDYPGMIEQYPAHLHIDVMPTHQNQGWGQQLIAALFQKILAENVIGVYLGMSADNDGAGRFYERLGFERYSEMKDKGEIGRDGNAVYWVRRFQRDRPE